MVLREDQEKVTYTQKVDFAKLRSELLTADSTESSLSRASHERLTNELAKLNSRLRDEIQRTQASVRLDLNLEKGRIREEANVQELKIKETETRIEQETAVLRERLEAVKFSTLQWLMYVSYLSIMLNALLIFIQRCLHGYCRTLAWCMASLDVSSRGTHLQDRDFPHSVCGIGYKWSMLNGISTEGFSNFAQKARRV
jgi:hypothetical protein